MFVRRVVLHRTFLLLVTVVAVAAGAIVWHLRERPDERFQQALVALEARDFSRVEAAIKALQGDGEYEPHRRLLQGGYRLRLGNPYGALRDLSAVEPAGELREPAHLLTGEALYQLGRLAEAEQVFLQLERTHPDHPQACRWLAAIYYDLGANHHAIERLERLAKLKPDDFTPHHLLAVMHSDFEQFPQAIQHYQQALRRSPPETVRQELLRGLGRALVRERRYDEALRVLEGGPVDAEVLALRSEASWSLGARDDAWKSLERARAMDARERSVLWIGARMHLDSDRPAEAVPLLRQILEADPHDIESRYHLATAYRQMGRLEDSDRELERRQVSYDLRERLSKLSLRAMDEPRNAELRDELAEVCRQLGKHELAATWQRAAEQCRQFEQLPQQAASARR